MDIHELATQLFKKAYDFKMGYRKRVDQKGIDNVAKKYAEVADIMDKAYSFVTDAMAKESREEMLQAEKQALSGRCEDLKQQLDQWERAYRYYSDMACHNKIEEMDRFIEDKTGRKPHNDSSRINAFKEIIEKD